jgi:hypothetical protein
MSQMNSPFMITLLPGNHPCKDGQVALSVCVEINPHLKPNAAGFSAWYRDIMSFHPSGQAAGLYDRLCTLIEAISPTSLFKLNGISAPATICSATPEPKAREHWAETMKINVPQGAAQPEVPEMRRPVTTSRPTPNIVTATTHVPVDEQLEGLTVGRAAGVILSAGSMSGVRTLSVEERDGILKAAEQTIAINTDRLRNAPTMKRLRQSFTDRSRSDLHVASENLKAVIETTTKDFILTADYVTAVFDGLNASTQSREFFGTLIHIALDVPLPPDDVSFSVVFTVPDTMADHPFYCPPTALVAKTFAGQRRVLVRQKDASAVRDIIRDSVLQLQPEKIAGADTRYRTRVLGFEPQSAAFAVEEGAVELAERNAMSKPGGGLHRSIASLKFAEPLDALPKSPEISQQQMIDAFASIRADAELAHVLRRANNRKANTPTRGLVVYHLDPGALVKATETDREAATRDDSIYAGSATRGYTVYVREAGGDWMSLTTIAESLRWSAAAKGTSGDPEGEELEMGIHIGGAVEAVDKSGSVYELRDGFLLAWDGTPLSAQSPFRNADREEADCEKAEAEALLRYIQRTHEINEPEVLAAQLKLRPNFGVTWFPVPKIRPAPPVLEARRSWAYRGTKNPVRLHFGGRYQFLAVAQYRNGYVPIDSRLLNLADSKNLSEAATEETTFLRYDHIRDIVVSFEQDIYRDRARRQLRHECAGESALDLAVRSGQLLDNDECTRVLLPPPVPTFQTYLWYAREDLDKMGPTIPASPKSEPQPRSLLPSEIAEWYRRYASEEGSAKSSSANVRARNSLARITVAEEQTSEDWSMTQPPVYVNELRYLPDPVVTGIEFVFFHDADCKLPALDFDSKRCHFMAGRYPDLQPWRLTLAKRRDKQDRVVANEGRQVLTVRLAPGEVIYARATPMYREDRAHFAKGPVDESKYLTDILSAAGLSRKDASGECACLLHANPTVFSLTHATQRPLKDPEVGSIWIRRSNPTLALDRVPAEACMFDADIDINTEQLNIRYGVPDMAAAPTGDLDLFAVWDEYDSVTNGPSMSIEQKKERGGANGGFVRVGRLQAKALRNVAKKDKSVSDHDLAGYRADVTIRSDHAPFTYAGFTRVEFRIRNTSAFYSFFHVGSAMSDSDVELHSRWSKVVPVTSKDPHIMHATDQVRASFMPSNVKPDRPVVRKIVGLVTRDFDEDASTLQYRGNRVRVYLEPLGRQKTGPERIGILVADPDSKSPGLLMESVSVMGQDIVTDGILPDGVSSRDSRLTASAFRTSLACMENHMKGFAPTPVAGLFGGGIGLVSYVPRYDATERLWFVDLELNVFNAAQQELHNPFIRLGLVTHQPYAANYDAKTDGQQTSLAADFRVSPVELSEFFSIYPSRMVSDPLVLFGNTKAFTLSGSVSSLFFWHSKPAQLRSQFIFEMQCCEDGGFWQTMESSLVKPVRVRVSGDPVGKPIVPSMPPSRHLLLPVEISQHTSASALFEIDVEVDYTSSWLHPRNSGRYRGVIREVELFPTSNEQSWATIAESLLTDDVAQIPGLRTKQVMLLTPRL